MASRCQAETERFFQQQEYDPRFCFELFRRAAGNDQLAWERVYACYLPLVTGWVKRHSAYPISDETPDYFANRAFERLWSALEQRGFQRFENLASVLRYLQLCVHSVIIDHNRAAELDEVQLEARHQEAANPSGETLEGSLLDRSRRSELWIYLESCLNDEQERTVVYCSFVLGLKPRQIEAQFQSLFDDVTDVYRVKQNVLARLQRDPQMEQFLVRA